MMASEQYSLQAEYTRHGGTVHAVTIGTDTKVLMTMPLGPA